MHVRIQTDEIRANRMQEPKGREMMKKMFLVLLMSIGLIALGGGTSIRAQQPAASPNWADTIAWINNVISQNAHMSFSSIAGIVTQSESHYVSYSPGPSVYCHITVVEHDSVRSKDGSGIQSQVIDSPTDYDLSQWVAGSVQPLSFNLHDFAFSLMGGASDPNMTVTVESPVGWIISAQIASPNAAPATLTSDPTFNALPVFTDQSMAARVATALNHAVDLCGGKPAPKSLF
jgi:hypothetical protein